MKLGSKRLLASSLTVVCVAVGGRAEASRPGVILLAGATSDRAAMRPLEEQIRAELSWEGHRVIVRASDQELPPPQDAPWTAVIRLHAPPNERPSVFVWIAQRGHGQIRRFHAVREDEVRVLALRVVEYIRGAHLDVTPTRVDEQPEPPRARVPVVNDEAALSWRGELGAQLWLGTSGQAPAWGPALALSRRWSRDLWLELRGSIGFSSLEDSRGTVHLQHLLGSVGLRYEVALGPRVRGFASSSIGAYRLGATANAASPSVARDDAELAAAGRLGGGACLELVEVARWSACARAELLVTTPRITVRSPGAEADRMAQPTLLGAAVVQGAF